MKSIWFRSFFLLSLGVLLGAVSNWKGPNPVPWIRGQQSNAPATGAEKGDLSLAAMRYFSESDLVKAGMALILDARQKVDYDKGRIPNSISMDVRQFETLFPQIQDRLLPGSLVIIYCTGGQCEDSHTLSERLKPYEVQALIFSGGWEAWTTAGYPVESGEAK